MAEVYSHIRGKPIEDWLAHTRMVRGALKDEAHEIGRRAKAIHRRHRAEGHSYIEVKRLGTLDWYVILNDERGLAAALSIEYGRDANAIYSKPWAGTNTLHRAAGIPIRNTFPRSRPRGKLTT